MDSYQQSTHYPQDNRIAYPSQAQRFAPPQNLDGDGTTSSTLRFDPAHSALPQPEPNATSFPYQDRQSMDAPLVNDYGGKASKASFMDQFKDLKNQKLDKKWQQRLYWIVPLVIVAIVLTVLFEVYKTNFEHWVQPLANWLKKREAWSWSIPVAILIILSFPPLFGHEIVQLIVGLTYPLSVAIGIAAAGSVLGEAACFVVFKLFGTKWVDKKIATNVKWAAITRVSQEAGFKGVLVIRYSIVPPHLANPLFACTGMKFWLYMVTVILSLPKPIVFVALGTPSSDSVKWEKYAKVIAVGVLVVITVFASHWIRGKMKVATKEIEAERGIYQPTEELGRWSHDGNDDRAPVVADTSYHGNTGRRDEESL